MYQHILNKYKQHFGKMKRDVGMATRSMHKDRNDSISRSVKSYIAPSLHLFHVVVQCSHSCLCLLLQMSSSFASLLTTTCMVYVAMCMLSLHIPIISYEFSIYSILRQNFSNLRTVF